MTETPPSVPQGLEELIFASVEKALTTLLDTSRCRHHRHSKSRSRSPSKSKDKRPNKGKHGGHHHHGRMRHIKGHHHHQLSPNQSQGDEGKYKGGRKGRGSWCHRRRFPKLACGSRWTRRHAVDDDGEDKPVEVVDVEDNAGPSTEEKDLQKEFGNMNVGDSVASTSGSEQQ